MSLKVDYPASILDSKLFNSLKDAEMKLLIKEATLKTFKTGEFILKEANEGAEFYWISKGSVAIEISASTADGAPLKLTTLSKGDILGEMVLLGFPKRAASAIALEECSLYVWDMKKTLDLFMDHPAIAYRVTRNLGHMLGERLIRANLQLRGRVEAMDAALIKDLV